MPGCPLACAPADECGVGVSTGRLKCGVLGAELASGRLDHGWWPNEGSTEEGWSRDSSHPIGAADKTLLTLLFSGPRLKLRNQKTPDSHLRVSEGPPTKATLHSEISRTPRLTELARGNLVGRCRDSDLLAFTCGFRGSVHLWCVLQYLATAV